MLWTFVMTCSRLPLWVSGKMCWDSLWWPWGAHNEDSSKRTGIISYSLYPTSCALTRWRTLHCRWGSLSLSIYIYIYIYIYVYISLSLALSLSLYLSLSLSLSLFIHIRAALEGKNLWGRTPICENLRRAAVVSEKESAKPAKKTAKICFGVRFAP